ncbi:hypothetical protein Rs2_41420 [Raphanus sativus]|nr:hypothetical protein Rs2_41420 [Raphanus sativus]
MGHSPNHKKSLHRHIGDSNHVSRSAPARTHVSLDPFNPTSVAATCRLRRPRPRLTRRRKTSEPNQIKSTGELHRGSPEISNRIDANPSNLELLQRRRASIAAARSPP